MPGANTDHPHPGPSRGHKWGRQKALTSDPCVGRNMVSHTGERNDFIINNNWHFIAMYTIFVYYLCIFMLYIINIYYLFFYFHI